MSTPSDLPAPSTQELPEKQRWVEPVAALLMALATLITASCSYQSAAWTRQSNRLMNEFNTLERRARLMCGLCTGLFFVVVNKLTSSPFEAKPSQDT